MSPREAWGRERVRVCVCDVERKRLSIANVTEWVCPKACWNRTITVLSVSSQEKQKGNPLPQRYHPSHSVWNERLWRRRRLGLFWGRWRPLDVVCLGGLPVLACSIITRQHRRGRTHTNSHAHTVRSHVQCSPPCSSDEKGSSAHRPSTHWANQKQSLGSGDRISVTLNKYQRIWLLLTNTDAGWCRGAVCIQCLCVQLAALSRFIWHQLCSMYNGWDFSCIPSCVAFQNFHGQKYGSKERSQ